MSTSVRKLRPEGLFSANYWMHQEMVLHERQVYNFFRLAEDLGGVLMMLYFLGITILHPYARYSFNMDAIQRLFRIRTADRKLLKHAVDKKGTDA